MHTRMWQMHSVHISYQETMCGLHSDLRKKKRLYFMKIHVYWMNIFTHHKLPWVFTFYFVQHHYRLNANSGEVITYILLLFMLTSSGSSPWHNTMTTYPTPTTYNVSTTSCIILYNLFTVCCQNVNYWFICSLANCQFFLLVYVPEWKRDLHFLLHSMSTL